MGGVGQSRRRGMFLLKWIARLSGSFTGGFWLFMLMAESWGKWEGLTRLKPAEGMFLGLMTLYALSMFAVWFAQSAGAVSGLLSLVSLYLLIGARLPDAILHPYLLALWPPVLLHLLFLILSCRRPTQVEATA